MPPIGSKHWCKLCKKSFPSCYSLGGHMNLHRDKRKQNKLPRSTLSRPNIGIGAGGYGLRERRHNTWLLCDSSDDEYQTMVPKKECQLCFKVFASCHALSMHMRVHTRHERKMVAKEASRKGTRYRDHNVTLPTSSMSTYGIQEVNAARVLLMISGHSGMDSASEDCNEDYEMDGNMISGHSGMESASEHCNEDYEMDGNSAYRMQKNGQIWGADLMMPESPSSDVKLKFSSLSQVLKVTESHDCKLCGKVFTSSKGLASHKKFHKADSRLLCLNLPGFIDRKYRSRSPKTAQTPWWTTRGFRTERIMGVV